ncbi:hypothetical protein FB45DRAFT_68058 [Roridomyces roridus]|uniref:Uncharacterized protein n=1 Tax=Roridomyces roridus TaxID=1738132 RepID=A0AAD7FKL4_9AGAR|nr:hypothetical protein FB45DRAFT_68058 [Roridomyces roridus]
MHPWASSPISPRNMNTSEEQSWIDCTSLDVAIDHSCLESLDDQLLHHPRESFADICWAEAVQDFVRESPQRSQKASPVPDPSVEVSVPDHVEHLGPLPTVSPDYPAQPLTDRLNTAGSRQSAEVRFDAKSTIDTLNLPSTRKVASASFVPALLPYSVSAVADPSESIGFFPTPSPRRSSKRPNRFLSYFSFYGRPLSRRV